MDGWTTLGEAAARVVEGARCRMEEKSDERAQWSASALAAVARDREETAGEGTGKIAGGERHAAASRAEALARNTARAKPIGVALRKSARPSPGGAL